MDLNVVCFLWHGDRWKAGDMGAEYVNRLFGAVRRHLSLSHRFICFTNSTEGIDPRIEILELNAPSWMGCLPKISMFNPALGLTGQVLALDIDLIIVGSLDDIGSYRGDLCVRSKFKPGEEWKADGDIIGFRVGSQRQHEIWEPFVKDPKMVERITGGRERYWYRYVTKHKVDRWQDLYPGQIVSYKRHVRGKGLSPEARIVSCHGRPRPHEIDEPWTRKCWA
jgi:hypothetical protein